MIGDGNVALDVARILAKTADELRRTDIATHALEVLAESRIRDIHVVGRGKPSQAKFTARELRDFLELEACEATVDGRDVTPEDFAPDNPNDAELAEKLSLLGGFSRQASLKRRRCVFRFGLSPMAIRGQGRGEAIAFGRGPSGAAEDVGCGLVFRSVGRRRRNSAPRSCAISSTLRPATRPSTAEVSCRMTSCRTIRRTRNRPKSSRCSVPFRSRL